MSLTRRRQLLVGGLAAVLGLCIVPGCQLAPVAPQPETVAARVARDGSAQGGWLARLGAPRKTIEPASGSDTASGTAANGPPMPFRPGQLPIHLRPKTN